MFLKHRSYFLQYSQSQWKNFIGFLSRDMFLIGLQKYSALLKKVSSEPCACRAAQF